MDSDQHRITKVAKLALCTPLGGCVIAVVEMKSMTKFTGSTSVIHDGVPRKRMSRKLMSMEVWDEKESQKRTTRDVSRGLDVEVVNYEY